MLCEKLRREAPSSTFPFTKSCRSDSPIAGAPSPSEDATESRIPVPGSDSKYEDASSAGSSAYRGVWSSRGSDTFDSSTESSSGVGESTIVTIVVVFDVSDRKSAGVCGVDSIAVDAEE